MRNFYLTIVGLVFVIFGIIQVAYYGNFGYFLFEDNFKVVQVVEEVDMYDVIDMYMSKNIDDEKLTSSEYIAELNRPRPYVLETIYKGVSNKIYGDAEYLKKYKCSQIDTIYKKYNIQVEAERNEEILLENSKKKKARDLKSINSLDCN